MTFLSNTTKGRRAGILVLLGVAVLVTGCTKTAVEEKPTGEAAQIGEARFDGESLTLAGIETALAEERSLTPVLTVCDTQVRCPQPERNITCTVDAKQATFSAQKVKRNI